LKLTTPAPKSPIASRNRPSPVNRNRTSPLYPLRHQGLPLPIHRFAAWKPGLFARSHRIDDAVPR
jgi:hypothetical protein